MKLLDENRVAIDEDGDSDTEFEFERFITSVMSTMKR